MPVFTDAALSAQLNPTGTPFGNPFWGNFDNDGDLDMFVDNHYSAASYFYRNNGDGTFTDILSTSGLKAAADRHGSGRTEIDNDGPSLISSSRSEAAW
ncbi:MAG: VCBS repeat-containing protein [Chthoniobacterales bacterium]